MGIINRSRVLRPSTHAESSPYRIHCNGVGKNDVLRIKITHESDKSIDWIYEISGSDLRGKKSIHFLFHNHKIKWLDNVNPRRIRG